VADEQRTSQRMESLAVGGQRDVVFMRLAEADAGIQANPVSLDAGRDQSIAPFGQIMKDLVDHVVIRWIDLHRLRSALHVHRHNSRAAFHGHMDHLRITFESRDVIDDFGAGFDRSASHHRLGCVDRHRN
jgi:hypothetical protein